MYSIRNTGSALTALVGSTVVPATDLMVFSPCPTFSSRIVGTCANPNLGRPAAKLSTSTRVNGEHGSEAFERGENGVRARLGLELEDPVTDRDAGTAPVRLVYGVGETDQGENGIYTATKNHNRHSCCTCPCRLSQFPLFLHSFSIGLVSDRCYFLSRRSIRPSPHRPSPAILTCFCGYKPNQEPCVIRSLSASSPTSLLPFSLPAT